MKVAALREVKNFMKPVGKAEPKESPIKRSYALPPKVQDLEERQENDNSSQWTLEDQGSHPGASSCDDSASMVVALSILISPSRLREVIPEEDSLQETSQCGVLRDEFNEAVIMNSQFMPEDESDRDVE
jgi:hypothetical protein